MSRIALAVLALLFFGLASDVDAGSASATLAVSVTVTNNCTISTTPLAFGSYDPILANSTAPLNGNGAVTIACTTGTAPAVGIGTSNGASRQMSNGSVLLSYEIYKDPNHTSVWGNSGPALLTPGTAANANPRTFTVSGQIPAGQDVPSGSYSDAVVATVNF